MEKEYKVKLTIEFEGVGIGENRKEAIEDLDILDFIDEAAHSGHFTIKNTKAKVGLLEALRNGMLVPNDK